MELEDKEKIQWSKILGDSKPYCNPKCPRVLLTCNDSQRSGNEWMGSQGLNTQLEEVIAAAWNKQMTWATDKIVVAWTTQTQTNTDKQERETGSG